MRSPSTNLSNGRAEPRTNFGTIFAGRLRSWVWLLAPAMILYLAAYLPSLLLLVNFSVQTYVPGSVSGPPITLANYANFLADPYYRGLAVTTVWLSGLSSLITVGIAYPMAYKIVRSRRQRRVLLPVVAISFFVSSLVRLYGWLGILARGGPLNELLTNLGLISHPISMLFTPAAVMIGLVDFGIPYAVLTLIGSINNLDQSLEHASQNLGATNWQTFLRVTMPLTFPGLLAALVLTFALNVSAVLTPIVLGGSRVPTMATQIYDSMVTTLNYPFASATIVILLVSVFLLVLSTGGALRTRSIR